MGSACGFPENVFAEQGEPTGAGLHFWHWTPRKPHSSQRHLGLVGMVFFSSQEALRKPEHEGSVGEPLALEGLMEALPWSELTVAAGGSAMGV